MALIGVINDTSAPPLGALGPITPDVGSTCLVNDLRDALAEEHTTDAHLVAYVVHGHDGQPMSSHSRLARGDEARLFSRGFNTKLNVLVVDVNGATTAAPPATALSWRDGDRLRIVQPLTRAVDIDQADAIAESWHRGLEAQGLPPLDPPDWTRAYRLPSITLGGFPFASRVEGAGTPIAPPAPAAPTLARHAIAPAPPTVAEQLDAALRSLPEGASCIKAPPGSGKTVAVLTHALGLAAMTCGPTSSSKRAPVGSKCALCVPTTATAKEKAAQMAELGGTVARHHGMNADGAPGREGCKLLHKLRMFSAAGQSGRARLCDGNGAKPLVCPHRDGCDVYNEPTVDGDPKARFAIGTHAMLGRLASHAGAGLIAIDDLPSSPIERHAFTAEDLEAATKHARSFEAPFTTGLVPILQALADWLRTSPEPGGFFVLSKGVRADLLEQLERSYGNNPIEAVILPRLYLSLHRPGPITDGLDRAMELARDIGLALRSTRVCATVTVDQRDGARKLCTFGVDRVLERVLTESNGKVVLLGADVDLYKPILDKLLASPMPLRTIEAADAVPVERRMMPLRAAGPRDSIFDGKKFRLTPAVLRAVEWAVDWALNGHTADGVLFVCRKPLRLALEAAAPSTTAARSAEIAQLWTDEVKQTAEALDQAVAQLVPLLAPLGAAPLGFGHFFATRGLDSWKTFGSFITIGDPWPDKDLATIEAAWLLGADADPKAIEQLASERMKLHAAAELEQCHGRARTIYRTTPARLLHVGHVEPGGWAGRCAVDKRHAGRPPNRAKASDADLDVALEEIRALLVELGGERAAERSTRIPRSTLLEYRKGRPAPLAARAALREAVARLTPVAAE